MKKITFLLIPLILLLSFSGCNSDSKLSSNEPPSLLLNRSNKIKLDKEWDNVQNQYSNLSQALKKNNSDHFSRLELAQLYIKEARVTGEHGHYYPAALAEIELILNADELQQDVSFLALMHKAGIQLSLHEFSEALKTGEKAIILNPRNAQIYGVLVDAHVELGNYSKAIELADKMINLKPDIRSYSRVSYLREIHGDVPGAIQAMTMAVESGYPGYEETAWAMLTLGEMYQKYGELENAEKVFKAILEMRKDYPFAVAALGDIAFEKNNLQEAEKRYREAMDIIPEVGFYVSLSKVMQETGRAKEFLALSKEIDLMLKDDVDHGHNMNLEYASIYLEQRNDIKTALKFAQEEYLKRPNNIDVNRIMAEVHLKMDDKNKVKGFVRAASITKAKYPGLLQLQSQLKS